VSTDETPTDAGAVTPTASTARRRTRQRWALVVVVLTVAAAVALWPRGGTGGSADDPGAAIVAGQRPVPDLAQLRERAALAPCPGPGPTTEPAAGPGPLAGVQVPCLADGSTVRLASALAGRPVLLNVWSHTCQPCREELPVLQRYAAGPGAVEVLGVQVDGSEQAGLALLTALGVRLPSVTDPDGSLRAALGAPQVLPLTYIVDASGAARLVNPPVVFRSPGEVAETVSRYLTEAAQP